MKCEALRAAQGVPGLGGVRTARRTECAVVL